MTQRKESIMATKKEQITTFAGAVQAALAKETDKPAETEANKPAETEAN